MRQVGRRNRVEANTGIKRTYGVREKRCHRRDVAIVSTSEEYTRGIALSPLAASSRVDP